MLKPTLRTTLARPKLASGGSEHCQEATRRLSGIQYLNQTGESKLDSAQNETRHSG